jgi:hypothetical protein
MRNFKQWFKNLRQGRPTRLMEGEVQFVDTWEIKYEFAQTDVKFLKWALANALNERKTCTSKDFSNQLSNVMEANAAVVQQRLLGAQANSEITKVTTQHFNEELAKLKFLVFEQIDITAEAGAKRIEEYLDYHKEMRK